VTEFQPHVIEVLSRLLPNYDVIKYEQTISWNQASSVKHQPDLAIISKNRRNWTIIEVELHTHEVGHSYSSEKSAPHIYRQVETFADGDYSIEHIKKIAGILGEDYENLEPLLSTIPDVLVIGDNSDVLFDLGENNWERLYEIGENVHLAFLEVFEDPNNPSDTCSNYQGWLPPADISFSQRLTTAMGDWVDSLCGFQGEPMDCPDGDVIVEIDGISTTWNHVRVFNILQAVDIKAVDYLNRSGDGAIFDFIHTGRGFTLEMRK